jgi:hypothetical protein
MQDTDKNITWKNPGIVVEGSPPLQAFLSGVNKLIGQQYSIVLPSPQTVEEAGILHPAFLTTDKLLFLLINYPQPQVRKLLKRYIKEILHITNQNLPAGIHSGPAFYPEIADNNVSSELDYPLRNEDVESILKISETVLFYNAYTGDPDFLTSDSFNMVLRVSRFWASFLSNPKTSELWLAEKGSLAYLQIIAAETLKFALEFIGYLKAESSWLYEDLREQNKFSEIKETSSWKKIIHKEGAGKVNKYDFASFPEINNKLVPENDFSDYIRNLANQYMSENEEFIMDENTLSSIWLNIIYHCFGLSISEKILKLVPSLPVDWRLCKLVIHYRKSVLELEITSEKMKVTNLSANPVDIKVLDRKIRVPGLSKEMLTFNDL